MKNVISTLILFIVIFCPAIGTAQEKITGFGPFKIGMKDTSIVYNYAEEQGWPFIVVSDLSEQLSKSNRFAMKLVVDTVNNAIAPINASYCPESLNYYLPEYKIADIKVKDLCVSYYQGRLISISADNCPYELSQAWEAKFGKPTISSHNGVDRVILPATGAKVEMPSKTYYTTWSNGDISATVVLTDGFNEDGTRKLKKWFYIHDIGNYKVEQYCDEDMKKALRDKESVTTRDKYKDL